MTTEILFDHFHQLITRAEDIPRLNELILQLAVRGKLVPQDPADEPACELLKHIAAEKVRLVKEKKIRKSQKLPPIDADEIPFGLPSGWEWVRLPEIYHDCGQTKPNKQFTYIDVSSINNTIGVIGDDLQVIEPTNAPSRARKLVGKGTVIYSTVRPYLLNVAIVDREFDPPPIVSTAFAVMHPFEGVDKRFLFFYLRSKPFIEFVESQMTGMAYPAISDSKLAKGLFPLPPLAEQQRIVERVEQLLDQSRALEAELAAAEAERATLTQASLHHLTVAPNPAALSEQWQQLASIFDTLLTDPAAVADLKQAILQLAVQGRLVEQDPTDEPAGELLKRIAVEKKRLAETETFRKSKPLPQINKDKIPFDLPPGWEWTKIDQVCLESFYGPRFGKNEYVKNGIPTIRTTDMTINGEIVLKDPPQVKFSEEKLDNFRLKNNDLLITRTGSIGVMAIFRGDYLAIPSAYLIRFRFSSYLSIDFVYSYLKSPLGQEYMGLKTTKTTQPNINAQSIRNIPIPLPPLAEQQRIVERVEQLLALCDDLQAQLAAGETARVRLLESLLWQAGGRN
ncbi:MAG: restriction endonuclease subunit S [Anaerolineae bacterium]|nr:restriction endonuclease subunit S [Anaerolineae bacterium]